MSLDSLLYRKQNVRRSNRYIKGTGVFDCNNLYRSIVSFLRVIGFLNESQGI